MDEDEETIAVANTLALEAALDGGGVVLICSTGKPCTYPSCAPSECADRLLAHLREVGDSAPDG